jgi:class 3 adenylate cyclase
MVSSCALHAGALRRRGAARGARRLQEQLRQYVPTSIATRLAEGRTLEAGEREVSVLFADLRGYESRRSPRRDLSHRELLHRDGDARGHGAGGTAVGLATA